MRFCHVLACSLCFPLAVFAQSTQPSAASAPQTPSAQQSAPSLQLHDLSPEPHTLTPEEQAEQKATQMRIALTRVARAQANWGPAESAPGMSLQLKEMSRAKTATGTEITYQLTGKGFTPDMRFTLVRWPLNQNITQVMSGIVIDATGTAVCGAGAPALQTAPVEAAQVPSCTKTIKPGTPIQITTTAAKGEAVRVALAAADHQHGAAVSLVPFPIEGENQGCKLQVLLGSKDAELVLVEGDGFKQDATYTLGTESWNEKHPLAVKINPQGHFVAALTPWAPNHDIGDTVVYYQSSTCTPTVSFHWGKDTYKPE